MTGEWDITYPTRRLTCDVADAVQAEFPTWNMGEEGADGPAGTVEGSAGPGQQPWSRATGCGGGLIAVVVNVVAVDSLVNSSSSTSLQKLTGSWPTSDRRHVPEVLQPEVADWGGGEARGAIVVVTSSCGRAVYPLRADVIEDIRSRSVFCAVADAPHCYTAMRPASRDSQSTGQVWCHLRPDAFESSTRMNLTISVTLDERTD